MTAGERRFSAFVLTSCPPATVLRLEEHQITFGRAEEAHDWMVVAWPQDKKRIPFTKREFVGAVVRAFHNRRRRDVASAGDFRGRSSACSVRRPEADFLRLPNVVREDWNKQHCKSVFDREGMKTPARYCRARPQRSSQFQRLREGRRRRECHEQKSYNYRHCALRRRSDALHSGSVGARLG